MRVFLRVIDGRNCDQQATFPDQLIASQSIAIADLGGPGDSPEIVAQRQDGGLIAFTQNPNGTWAVLWRSADNFGDALCNWTGISIHDLDDDGAPEIMFQGAVYSAAGVLLNTPLVGTTATRGTIRVVLHAELHESRRARGRRAGTGHGRGAADGRRQGSRRRE